MSTVTFTLSKTSPPFARQGEIFVLKTPYGKRYNIVLNDSTDYDNIYDEEFGISMQSTFSLRPLSKFKPIRFFQIKYYRTKFYIKKLKSKSKT